MRGARIAVAVCLLVGLAAPAAAPFVGSILRPDAWSVWGDAGRIGELVRNTIALAVGAILVAVPVGTVGGIILARVPFPGRRVAIGIVAVGLFIPLPVYAVAWQVILSGWVPVTAPAPGEVAWRPWAQGMLPAAWVHGTAAVPWVIGIVAAGLFAADRGLEEDALMTGGPGDVFRRVLLPRVVPAAVVGAAWVAVSCATEIAVTDAMMVRTLAEEAYTQMVVGYRPGAAAAAAVTLPFLLLAATGAVVLVNRLGRYLPSGSGDGERPIPILSGRRSSIRVAVAVWLVIGLLAGLPFAAIVWKAAGGGSSAGGGMGRLAETMSRLARTDGIVLAESLFASVAAGLIAAALAWAACGLAVRCRWMSAGLLFLCIILWLTPGPLLGFGLKEWFGIGMAMEDRFFRTIEMQPTFPPVRSLVYDQPSPVPVVWAGVLRWFPLAAAVVWPAVRAIPRDLLESAAVDGLGVAAYFRRVVVPVAGPAFGIAAVAVAALALGEVSLGKLVAPPGYRAFVLELFAQMHYGTDATVCGLCLVQLAVIAVGVCGFWLVRVSASLRRSKRPPSPVPGPPARSE